MIKKILAGLGLLLVSAFGVSQTDIGVNAVDSMLGGVNDGSQWQMYDTFTGYETKNDPSKINDGGNAQGQNTIINNGDRISIRDFGLELLPSTGTASTSAQGITSMHTFRKRSGENILMRFSGTTMEYFDEYSDVWETIKSGYATSSEFGFADYNINTDLVSYVYYGNGLDPFTRWSGAHTNLTSALTGGEATISVLDTTNGFTTTGSLVICGSTVTYTGKTATTFTGASGTPACANSRGVSQAVLETSSNPRGNIYLIANNRLFISGTTSSPQAVFFSTYGDATAFSSTLVTASTAASPGIFNLGEGGGPVTAMVLDENSIYIFKRSIIYKATLTDDLYSLTPLKSFDGKSRTTGAINQKSTFAGGNGIFFITPDNQIMNLSRIEGIDYPQLVPISDSIKPTIDNAIFTSSTGIFFKDHAYISAKTDSDSNNNDVVFLYNFRTQGCESPIIGWNVSDAAIYSSGEFEYLYLGSQINPNVFKMSSTPLDDIYGVKASWRSKAYTFGLPQSQKEISNVFLEGYIADNTSLTVSLLLDDNGFTQTYSATIEGTETGIRFDAPSYNVFGLSVFGTERFGSNDDFSGKRKFRVYLNKNVRKIPFYSAQIEFGSDGENQQWEILRYGFLTREADEPEKRSIYRLFQ